MGQVLGGGGCCTGGPRDLVELAIGDGGGEEPGRQWDCAWLETPQAGRLVSRVRPVARRHRW